MSPLEWNNAPSGRVGTREHSRAGIGKIRGTARIHVPATVEPIEEAMVFHVRAPPSA
jgi:hypothetical protein